MAGKRNKGEWETGMPYSPPPPPSPLKGEGEAEETQAGKPGPAEAGGLPAVLAPFSDNLPYDRDRVIQECKLCLQVEIMARFEVGRRLLLLREQEGVPTLAQILIEHFAGLSRRSAYRYMFFARKASNLPRFRAWADGKDNWSKAVALLECCEEEDLTPFEEGGDLLGLKRDELDDLSFWELKAKIKKLKKDKDEAVRKATDKLSQENQELKGEVAALQGALNPGLDECLKVLHQAEEKLLAAARLLRTLPQEMLDKETVLQDRALGLANLMDRLSKSLEDRVIDAEERTRAREAEGASNQ